MKHIKLFESFVRLNEEAELSDDLIFDWLPFDDQIDNPMNSQIPSEVKYSEIFPVLEKIGAESNSVGLFIAHKKLNEGFIRFIINTEKMPFSFDIAIFDKEFKKTSENKGVSLEHFDLSSYLRGSSILNRFKQ